MTGSNMNYAQMCEQALNSTCSSAKRDSVIASYASQHGVSGIPLAVATMLVNAPSTFADDYLVSRGLNYILR